MATVLDLDMTSGDLALSASGDLLFVEDVEAVLQRVAQRLGTRLGEWAFDLTVGVDWLRAFQEAPPDLGRLRAELIAQVEAPSEVERVTFAELVFVRETRVLHFTYALLITLNSGVSVSATAEATIEERGGELLVQVQMLGGV